MFQLLYTHQEFCQTSILIVALIFMQDSAISKIAMFQQEKAYVFAGERIDHKKRQNKN
jgi:hypothetical protein